MADSFQIAIDGPVAAGKGTVSRLVAERLGFLYVDTGAMYRVGALLCHRTNTDVNDEKAAATLLAESKIVMRNPTDAEKDGRLTTVLLNNEDVSWAIRTEAVGNDSSKIAAHSQVRQVLVKKQQEIAHNNQVVMEGRDITFRVLPHAKLKIYLTANDIVRAKRRHFDLQTRGQSITFEEVYQDLLERDKRDREREVDPLQQTPDSWVIDTSDLSIDQVVNLIVAKVNVMRTSNHEK